MKKVLIIGSGFMGARLAAALTRKYQVFIVEPKISVQAALLFQKGLSTASGIFSSLDTALQQGNFSIVIIATPMAEFESVLLKLKAGLNEACVITDISSAVKSLPHRLAQKILTGSVHAGWYIPSNPLTGGKTTSHALYKNKIVYLCAGQAQPEALLRLNMMWRVADAQPVELPSVKAHDDLTVISSLMPNILGFALQLLPDRERFGISPDIIKNLGKIMEPADGDVALKRWQRFLISHHQDVRSVLRGVAHYLKDKQSSVSTIMELVCEAMLEQIEKCRNHYDIDAKINLSSTPGLLRLQRVASGSQHTELPFQFTFAFADYLERTSEEFKSADRACSYIEKAFQNYRQEQQERIENLPDFIEPPEFSM